MVKVHTTQTSHAYPFPAVTLAYFLRYPNPFSTHVISTDTLSRHFDPDTQTLYTSRLHLKRSKIPGPLYRLLPKSILGPGAASGESRSFILERSSVDMRTGVMVTENRNLEFTGVLEVVERQVYRRPDADLTQYLRNAHPPEGFRLQIPEYWTGPGAGVAAAKERAERETDVGTKVELYSRLGQRMRAAREARSEASSAVSSAAEAGRDEDEPPAKVGFFQARIQKSIEAIGLRRTERAVPKSREGMNVVLERLRKGGLVGVLEGMKRDAAEAAAAEA